MLKYIAFNIFLFIMPAMIGSKIRLIASVLLFVFCAGTFFSAHACAPDLASNTDEIAEVYSCGDCGSEPDDSNACDCMDCCACACHSRLYLQNMSFPQPVADSAGSRFALRDEDVRSAFLDEIKRPPRP
jgi:hypothetical protein